MTAGGTRADAGDRREVASFVNIARVFRESGAGRHRDRVAPLLRRRGAAPATVVELRGSPALLVPPRKR